MIVSVFCYGVCDQSKTVALGVLLPCPTAGAV